MSQSGRHFLSTARRLWAEIFHSRPAKEPVAVVDLVNDQTRLKDNDVWDHGIMSRVGAFGDIQIFLDHATRVGKERPVGADSSAEFTSFRDVVGTDCDEPAIGDFELTMKLDEKLRLAALPGQ